MKILLHGATNWGSTNFGDFLYGYQIFKYLKGKHKNLEVNFFEPSKYFKKYIPLSDKVNIFNANYLVYIPGGYFGEGHNASLINNIIQFVRFIPFGLLGLLFHKKILVVGVGAGPLNCWFLRLAIKKICSRCKGLTVRDIESLNYLKTIGINKGQEYSDMMLAYNLSEISVSTLQTEEIEKIKKQGKKILLVHYNHSEEARDKFAEVASGFINGNSDYYVVVASDSILTYENDYYISFLKKYKNKCFHFIYDNPFEMIKLLEIVDVVLTCKLHVGVVSIMLNKPVICAAEHPEKSKRFYKLINHSENCCSLYENNSVYILNLLNKYKTLNLRIPNSEIEKAMCHWKTIDTIFR